MVLRRQHGQSPVAVHIPFGLVLLVVLVAFERIMVGHWREGSVLIGAALLLAAALRALLHDEQAGLLAIRNRVVDVFCCSGLGLMLVYLALTIKK